MATASARATQYDSVVMRTVAATRLLRCGHEVYAEQHRDACRDTIVIRHGGDTPITLNLHRLALEAYACWAVRALCPNLATPVIEV